MESDASRVVRIVGGRSRSKTKNLILLSMTPGSLSAYKQFNSDLKSEMRNVTARYQAR